MPSSWGPQGQRDRLSPLEESLPLKTALLLHLHRHLPVHVFMVYSERLSHLPSWFVQLHDESLGKVDRQGQKVGTTAVPALGPKDQHAQVQLFREGPLDKLLALVIPEAPLEDLEIPEVEGLEAASYLFGKTLFRLLKAEAEATYQALAEAGQRVYASSSPRSPPTPWVGSCSTSCGRLLPGGALGGKRL